MAYPRVASFTLPYKFHNIYVVACISVFAGILFGFDISSVSGFVGQKHFNNYFGTWDEELKTKRMLSTRQAGITASMSAGSFLGCWFVAWISDKCGRRFVLQLTSVIWMIGAAIQSSAQNVVQLIIGRLIAGVAIGLGSSTAPIMASELAPKQWRGLIGSGFQWSVTWGILIMFFICYGCAKIDGPAGFRIAWGIQIIPGLLLFFGTLVIEESPRWLAKEGMWDEAIRVLAATRANGNTNDPIIVEEIEEIKEIIRFEDEQKVGVRTMFKGKVNIRRTLVGVISQLWQQFTGMNVLMYYIVNIFTMAGYDGDATLTASIIQYVINVAMTVPALIWIDKVGRRITLLGGTVLLITWIFATLGLFAKYSVPTGPEGYNGNDQIRMRIPEDQKAASKAIIACSYLFVASFATSWGPGCWIYCSEIFPMRQRATGTSLTTGVNWGANFAIAMFTPPGFRNITYKTYAIYGACLVASFFSVYFFFIETKGKSLEEIEYIWESGVPAWKSDNFVVPVLHERQQQLAREADIAKEKDNTHQEHSSSGDSISAVNV